MQYMSARLFLISLGSPFFVHSQYISLLLSNSLVNLPIISLTKLSYCLSCVIVDIPFSILQLKYRLILPLKWYISLLNFSSLRDSSPQGEVRLANASVGNALLTLQMQGKKCSQAYYSAQTLSPLMILTDFKCPSLRQLTSTVQRLLSCWETPPTTAISCTALMSQLILLRLMSGCSVSLYPQASLRKDSAVMEDSAALMLVAFQVRESILRMAGCSTFCSRQFSSFSMVERSESSIWLMNPLRTLATFLMRWGWRRQRRATSMCQGTSTKASELQNNFYQRQVKRLSKSQRPKLTSQSNSQSIISGLYRMSICPCQQRPVQVSPQAPFTLQREFRVRNSIYQV